MKRLLPYVVFISLSLLLTGAQDGYTFLKVSPGCVNCHSFPDGAGLHTTHASDNCAVCHSATSSDVMTQTCIVCHPRGAPGKCQLVLLPSHPTTGAQECLACHNVCRPVNTSTSSTSTTTTPCPFESALGEDAQAIDQLRGFRDGKLARSAIGRKLTALYYANAESITSALERSPQLKAFARRTLTLLASMLAGKEE